MLNLHKPGRVRRVRDAAAKYQGPSLNDHLLTGPDLLNSCVGVLLRFSQELIAMSADIEAMFSQVVVPEEDQSNLSCVLSGEDRVPRHVLIMCYDEHLKTARIYFPWKRK